MFEPRRRQPVRALIAEHHPATRQCLRRCLKAAGCHVDEVFNGADALVKAFDYVPDLLFLDLSLPLMDGLSVLADLRLLVPTLKTQIIVLYRAKEPGPLSDATRQGIYDFISTPINEARLRACISVAMGFLNVWTPVTGVV